MNKIYWIALLSFLSFSVMSTYAQEETEESWEEESWEEEEESWEEESSEGEVEDPFASQAQAEPESPKVNFVNSCENRSDLRKSTKEQLLPYKYCNSKTTFLTFRKFPQRQEVVVPVYYEEEHLLVFNTEGLDQDILIKVYDKPSKNKKRKMIFESTKGDKVTLLELPKDYKESKLYIDYIVPPHAGEEGTTSKGCVVFMMGFLDEKFIDLKQSGEAN